MISNHTLQALTEEQHKKVELAHDSCVKESNVPLELVEKGRKGDFTDDDKLREFVFCFFKKIGFQNSVGDLQLDVIRTKLSTDLNQEQLEDVITKCKNVEGKNPADKAYEVYKCYWNKTPNHISFI